MSATFNVAKVISVALAIPGVFVITIAKKINISVKSKKRTKNEKWLELITVWTQIRKKIHLKIYMQNPINSNESTKYTVIFYNRNKLVTFFFQLYKLCLCMLITDKHFRILLLEPNLIKLVHSRERIKTNYNPKQLSFNNTFFCIFY